MGMCLVCGASEFAVIDKRREVPVMMHKTFTKPEEARQKPTGDINLMRCLACGFAWNSLFDPSLMQYDPSYNNCQTYSNVFNDHVSTRAQIVSRARAALHSMNIVEVGAGQGDFLRKLRSLGEPRVKGLAGFDPAFRGADGLQSDNIYMSRRFFDNGTSAELDHFPDVIVSRHTIEHIKNPLAFLEEIKSCIGSHDGTELFIETPDVQWIVDNQAFEDIFYEHCSLFDANSLTYALTRVGFRNVRVESCFGGQYLWAAGASNRRQHRSDCSDLIAISKERRTEIRTVAFASEWRNRLEDLVVCGNRVIVWGAGAKGVTFAQLIDPRSELITALVDVNPGKQGRFIAGSGHAILSPQSLQNCPPDCVIVTNPRYLAEIKDKINEMKLTCEIQVLH